MKKKVISFAVAAAMMKAKIMSYGDRRTTRFEDMAKSYASWLTNLFKAIRVSVMKFYLRRVMIPVLLIILPVEKAGAVDSANWGITSGPGFFFYTAADDNLWNYGTWYSGGANMSGGNDNFYMMGAGTTPAPHGDSYTEGSFYMGDGSDTVTIYSGATLGIILLDGGDDSGTADGFIDTLTFDGWSGVFDGSQAVNWENIVINGGTVSFSNNALQVGTDVGTGLILSGNSTLDGGSAFTLTGNLEVNSGATFQGLGGGAGVYSISGNVINNGILTTQDGAAGDTLTINGNYTGGGGTLQIDTVLGDDSSATDSLVINGNASGTTGVVLTNAGGTGAQTTNGILVVDVSGTSDTGAFLLGNGDYVLDSGEDAIVAGAYGYALRQIGNDWYLQSQLLDQTPIYQPATPVYEAYAQALLGMNGLPTLQQRVGNRYWNIKTDAYQTTKKQEEDTLIEESAVWIRIEGTYGHFEPASSTTGTAFSQNRWSIEAGANSVEEKDNGKAVSELLAYFGTQRTGVSSSLYGNGSISTKGYGIGANLTWYDNNGFYIDAQARATWYDSNLFSDTLGRLSNDNDGFGYALSAEVGKRMPWKDGWTFTPQAQLIYSEVDFDSFIGPNGEDVTLTDGDSLRGRLGISVEQEKVWKDEEGKLRRNHLYGIANLYYEFMDGTSVDVTGTALHSKPERLWGELGIGGSYNWDDDRYSFYGEITTASSLAHFTDSYNLNGNIGFRMRW